MRLTVGRKTAKNLAVGRKIIIIKKCPLLSRKKYVNRQKNYGNVQGLV